MRVVASSLALAVSLLAVPTYSVRSVGPANGVANAIANDGSIAGYSTDQHGNRTGFIFDGVLSILPSGTTAQDIASGVAVGHTFSPPGSQAAVWRGAAAEFLNLTDAFGMAINATGQVAGSALRNGKTTAFIQTGETTSWIGGGPWSVAYDLSDAGNAVGTYQTAGGTFRGFSWSAGGGFSDIGHLGGGSSWARAVNEAGAIAGSSLTGSGYLHAFLHAGGMIDLGSLGGNSAAYDVNSSQHAVGYSYDAQGRSRAFIWRGGIMFDLNTLIDPEIGWTLEAAYGINDRGQIVGTGLWDGDRRAFVLDPLIGYGLPQGVPGAEGPDAVTPESAVPEPGNLSIVVLSAALMLAIRRMKTESAPRGA